MNTSVSYLISLLSDWLWVSLWAKCLNVLCVQLFCPSHSCEWMNIKFRDRSKVGICIIHAHCTYTSKYQLFIVIGSAGSDCASFPNFNFYPITVCACGRSKVFTVITDSRLIPWKFIFDSFHNILNKPDSNDIVQQQSISFIRCQFYNWNGCWASSLFLLPQNHLFQ